MIHSYIHFYNETIRLEYEQALCGALSLRCAGWDAFHLDGLRPNLRCDGGIPDLISADIREAGGNEAWQAEYAFTGDLRLSLEFHLQEARLRVRSSFTNRALQPVILNEVMLLQGRGEPGALSFGSTPDAIRILEQGNYWGRVTGFSQSVSGDSQAAAGEPNTAASPADSLTPETRLSDFFSVIYDRAARMAFLAGFTSSERWIGRIHLAAYPDGRIQSWGVGFDGGNLTVLPGETITLEGFALSFGADPWALLEQYADQAARNHPVEFPERPPVSWCSWYPYRLSVSEERVLRNAQIAAERLKPLGLEIMEVDLGWERENLPSTFDENERFPHGLAWLADKLQQLGFRLGTWKAPYTISEFDPVCREHPEWLIHDSDGQPFAYWEWFWEPHGKVYILDLTHPGARAWLGEKVTSLYKRGVRYFKADFIGCVSDPRARLRYDPFIVAGGGCEAARLGAQVIRAALPDALLLNCGGPELPGTGAWPLLYTCNDTGNTGFISHALQQTNYQAVACHLFKNKRWGILQPSCLCVGLPGALEDARLRATVAYLAGGQVDISDDLTSLPEDRWAVLTATLPPSGITARPVDLFEPIYDGKPYDYQTETQGLRQKEAALHEHPAGSVWLVHVVTDWDEWDLVGVFCLEQGAAASSPHISRFTIPVDRLGIPAAEGRLAYEFWSGQFLGVVPGGRRNVGEYHHPGDFQELLVGGAPGLIELAFFAPSVKLLCLRRPRPHPWVVGASFHQSCGAELSQVNWQAQTATLRGIIRRPVGESGSIIIDTHGMAPLRAEVDGAPVPFRRGALDSLVLPVMMSKPEISWVVEFISE